MVAVSVSGHGVVFKVPVHPPLLKRGDICELDDPGFFWMVQEVRLLEQPGRFKVVFQPVLGRDTRYGEVAYNFTHDDVVLVMK